MLMFFPLLVGIVLGIAFAFAPSGLRRWRLMVLFAASVGLVVAAADRQHPIVSLSTMLEVVEVSITAGLVLLLLGNAKPPGT